MAFSAGTALAKAEPKNLRHRLLHTLAGLVHARRYRWLRSSPTAIPPRTSAADS